MTNNVSVVLLAVATCLVLVLGVVTPVARDSMSVHVVLCPVPSDPVPAAQPAIAGVEI